MAGKTPDRYIPYTITTAALTASTAPQTTPLALPNNVRLETVQILIPPGHAGQTGIRLQDAGATILPFSNPGQWISGDNRDLSFTLNVMGDATMSWQTFNAGNYPHIHYVLLHITDLQPSGLIIPTTSVIGMQG